MEAAAKNLNPALLELVGQTPAFVDATANIPDAAKKIVWGATAWGDIGWHTFRHTYRSWLDSGGKGVGGGNVLVLGAGMRRPFLFGRWRSCRFVLREFFRPCRLGNLCAGRLCIYRRKHRRREGRLSP